MQDVGSDSIDRKERANSLNRGSKSRQDETAEGINRGSRGDVLRMSGSNLHTTQTQMKDLFHRVVALEQKGRQMELLCQNLRSQVRELKENKNELSREEEKWEHLGRNCNGKFVWRINNFAEFHSKMRLNHSFVIYSRGFYTAPFAYKVVHSK